MTGERRLKRHEHDALGRRRGDRRDDGLSLGAGKGRMGQGDGAERQDGAERRDPQAMQAALGGGDGFSQWTSRLFYRRGAA